MVSVIVPLYKGNKYVKIIINMLLRNKEIFEKQSGKEILLDIIFVNDFPQEHIEVDHTLKLKYSIYHHKQNEGIHKSRVDGLLKSKGEYILFLDQDDTISDDYFLTQLNVMESMDADWVICNGIFRTNRQIFSCAQAIADVLDERHYFSSLTEIISPGQVMLKKSVIPDVWCDTILKNNYCDDTFLWLLLKNNRSKLGFNKTVVYFHNEDGSNESFKWKKNAEALRELKDIVVNINCLSATNLELFRIAVDKEIFKQETFGRLDDIYELLSAKTINLELGLFTKGHSIVIYGYGLWGRKLHRLLIQNGIGVEAVMDQNIKAPVDGVMICRPDTLAHHVSDINNCIVVVTPILDIDMINTIKKESGVNECVTIVELFERLYSSLED